MRETLHDNVEPVSLILYLRDIFFDLLALR